MDEFTQLRLGPPPLSAFTLNASLRADGWSLGGSYRLAGGPWNRFSDGRFDNLTLDIVADTASMLIYHVGEEYGGRWTYAMADTGVYVMFDDQ